MRRNRIIYYILVVLSIVLISFWGGAISYGLFFCVLLVPTVSFIYLLCVYITFRIYQKIDTRSVVAGDIVPYYFTLQNSGIIPFSGIRVNFYSSFSTTIDADKTQYEFAPHSGMKVSSKLVCKYRGEYEVGVKDIEISDFFNMFTVRFKNREPLRVIVSPRIVSVDEIDNEEIVLFSSRESSVNKSVSDVLMRDYVRGDDRRFINWKKSASAGKLMIRNFVGEEKNGIGIVLNAKRSSEDNMEYIPLEDKMLEKTLSLALYFLNRNIPVKEYTVTEDICETGIDNVDGFEKLYEQMTQVDFSSETTDADLIAKFSNSHGILENKIVFIITSKNNTIIQQFAGFLMDNNVETVVCEVQND